MDLILTSLTQQAGTIKPIGIFKLCLSLVTREGCIYIRHDDL